MKFSEENLLDITLILEQANGNILNDNDALLVKKSGLAHYSPEELETLLVNSIDSTELEYRGKAYWVLGKRFNTKLIPKFNEWLEKEFMSQNSDQAYQILIALDNLGLPAFGEDRDGSYSILDKELNLRDAKFYLNSHA